MTQLAVVPELNALTRATWLDLEKVRRHGQIKIAVDMGDETGMVSREWICSSLSISSLFILGVHS